MSDKPKLKLNDFTAKFWNLMKPFHGMMGRVFILTFIFEILGLVSPYIVKLIIDALTNFSVAELSKLISLLLIFFIAEQANSFSYYVRDRQLFRLLIDIEYHLPIQAQGKLMNLSLGYHETENTGNKIIKTERGLNKIIDLIGNVFWEVLPTLLQLVLTLAVLIFVDYRLALSFIFFVPLFIIITYRSNTVLYPLRKQRHKEYEEASGKMGQSIMNINAVQSFVQERREIKEFGKIKMGIRIKELKEWFRLLKFGLGRNLIIDLGRVAIIFLGIYLVIQKEISLGSLVFIFTLSEKAYFSLYRLSRFYDRLSEGAEGINRFADLLGRENTVKNKADGYRPKNLAGRIDFEKVDFSYRPDSPLALRKVNLNIKAGAVTALVGPSGGGKTTIAKLIYRHYDPSSGAVKIDDRDVRDYDLFSLRQFLAIVPQEVEIFDLSVRDNIAYAKPRASFKEIQAAARIANAEEFILKLDKGYDSLVGERGIKLSGGQRQRLGIARAILANPRILIFDEATSNLDSQSERLIQAAIEKIRKDRTLIIIAHRLSTIKKADQIIVLENGQIKEQGSHLELSRLDGGLYKKLIKLQSMGELD
ncbi:MAG: ABC transporter ATP-binding protein [Patescibacteria group bacterium]